MPYRGKGRLGMSRISENRLTSFNPFQIKSSNFVPMALKEASKTPSPSTHKGGTFHQGRTGLKRKENSNLLLVGRRAIRRNNSIFWLHHYKWNTCTRPISPICLMVRSSIDSRESLVWIGLSWAWASLVILPSGRIELVASAFPLSESLRGVTNPISQLVGQMHWHWRILFLLFQKRVQIPLPCCWVCPSFFLLEEWLASFFIHHWNWKLRNHPWWLFQFLIQLNCPAASSAFRSSWISRKEEVARLKGEERLQPWSMFSKWHKTMIEITEGRIPSQVSYATLGINSIGDLMAARACLRCKPIQE